MKDTKRIQFNMPIEMHKKLKEKMAHYGFSSVTPFIRFIIHRFFETESK